MRNVRSRQLQQLRLESLEARQLLTGSPNTYVNDTWLITNDVGPAGLSAGDTVQSNTFAGDSAVSNLTFGTDAFSNIATAMSATSDSGILHVLKGAYTQSTGAAGVTLAQNITLMGQGDADVTIDAGSSLTGIDVPNSAFLVNISGIRLTNFSSTGIHVQGNLNLSGSTVSDGFTGVWDDGGTLQMNSTVVNGAQIFEVQVSGASALANISSSEMYGTPTTVAAVVVSGGHADISGSILSTSAGRYWLTLLEPRR